MFLKGMDFVSKRILFLVIVITIATPLLIGCKVHLDNPIQPNTPNANSSIVWQSILGDADQRCEIRYMAVDSDYNIYFYAPFDDQPRLCRMSPDGSIVWDHNPECYVKAVYIIPHPSLPSDEALLVAGWKYTNVDDQSVNAVIIIYSLEGFIITRENIYSSEFEVWIRDIQLIESTRSGHEFMASGGARMANDRYQVYPYMVNIHISNDGLVSILQEKIFSEHPNNYIQWITWNHDVVSPMYFTTMAQLSQNETNNCNLFCISDSFTVEWICDIAPIDALIIFLYQIEYLDGAVYVVGQSRVLRNDTYRFIGIVASITESGETNWINQVQLSQFDDAYHYFVIDENALYAVGLYSHVVKESTNHRCGYSLLSKYELPSGIAVFHKSFGNYYYGSWFSTLDIKDHRMFCGGLTYYYIQNYWHQGWIVEIDINQAQTDLAIPIILETGNKVSSLEHKATILEQR